MNGATTGTYKPHLLGVLAGLFLAAGLVGSTMLFTRAWLRVTAANEITVSGSTRKAVRADLLVWRGSVTTEARTLLEAQRALKSDAEKVEVFLKKNQFASFTLSPISIQEVKAMEKTEGGQVQRTVRFRLTQGVEVRSGEVDRLIQLDRDSVALVEQGVLFTTSALEYIYSKAGEAKVELLAEATKDARARAEQIATQGGRSVDQLRSARMGVFQITPLYSLQGSWDGMNDTTSLDKTITAVVSATFSMK